MIQEERILHTATTIQLNNEMLKRITSNCFNEEGDGRIEIPTDDAFEENPVTPEQSKMRHIIENRDLR